MMMPFDWGIATDIWGALAATAATVIAWRVHKWQRASDQPIVTCKWDDQQDGGEWAHLLVQVNNVTYTTWQLSALHLLKPKGAKGISGDDASRHNSFTETQPKPESALDRASSVVRLHRMVDPAGTPPHPHYGGGSRTTESVFLHRPSMRSTSLSMRLILLSNDVVQRRIAVKIKRELPASSSAVAT